MSFFNQQVKQLGELGIYTMNQGFRSESTPPQVTTMDTNNGSHNTQGGFIQSKLPKGDQQPTAEKQITTKNEKTLPAKKRSHSRSHSKTRLVNPEVDHDQTIINIHRKS